MVSPCPPSTKAVTSSTETLNSCARNSRKRLESSTPAMPTTRSAGRPDFSRITHTIASSGLVMTMTKASRSEEHTSELQSRQYLVCRLLLEKKNNNLRDTHLYHS